MESYDTITVDAISPHLLNHGYASHLIRKTRAPRRPCGSSRDGVQHEWQSRHQDTNADRYIRSVTNIGQDFLTICFSQDQAQLWTKIHTFEMDMNFKKVHPKKGTVEREVIFGARVGLEAQFLVLARAYMSSQNTTAYKALFRELFRCLNEYGVFVQWQHIDQAGIYGLTMDQDAAAIKGIVCDIALSTTNAEISCGLSQAYSLLHGIAWHALRRDTNGVESCEDRGHQASISHVILRIPMS
ncbi:hypothetical protein E4U09_002799, partial [Claviceps aff. purpurea]